MLIKLPGYAPRHGCARSWPRAPTSRPPLPLATEVQRQLLLHEMLNVSHACPSLMIAAPAPHGHVVVEPPFCGMEPSHGRLLRRVGIAAAPHGHLFVELPFCGFELRHDRLLRRLGCGHSSNRRSQSAGINPCTSDRLSPTSALTHFLAQLGRHTLRTGRSVGTSSSD